MKKNILFTCAIVFSIIACKKEQNIVDKQEQLSKVKYVTTESTDIYQTMDEVEASLNQAFGNISGYKGDFEFHELIYNVILDEDGLVNLQNKTKWLTEQSATISSYKTQMNNNRRIFAVDVVEDAIDKINSTMTAVRVVVITVVNRGFEDFEVCPLKSTDPFQAAIDLSKKYNNCPTRQFFNYYVELETKQLGAYSQNSQIHYSGEDGISPFLFSETQYANTPFIKPVSLWNHYYSRLQDLIILEGLNVNYTDAVVNIRNTSYSAGGGPVSYSHYGEVIYGAGVYELHPF